MAIDRRNFLIGGVVALANAGRGVAGEHADAAFASACRREDGSYAIALIDATGRIAGELPIAGRAHDVAWNAAAGMAVAFARQPGRFAVAFDPHGARAPVLFAPPEDRCFFGHGVFSADGQLLYATENDISEGVGRIGVYDAGRAFARIGEFASGGIGPHELVLMDDGRTLAIANGGYETLPATGRQAIDVAGMQPSLTFVDRSSGDILARHDADAGLKPLSIRHLALGASGRVWFGCQWEGDPDATPEVIGFAARDAAPRLIQPKGATGITLKGYIGSVAISRDGGVLAASAPRAGRVLFIDTASAELRSVAALDDGCGVAATDAGFALSSGHGVMAGHREDTGDVTLSVSRGIAFDNHLRQLQRRA